MKTFLRRTNFLITLLVVLSFLADKYNLGVEFKYISLALAAVVLFLELILMKNPFWQYGTCRNRVARRHRIKGNVQFVLWKAGEHGHTKDYWYNFDSYWWSHFKK